MSGVKCECGRFLSKAQAVVAIGLDCHLEDVRGDCSRCGPDVRAGEGWWWSWDAWGLDEWADEQVAQLFSAVSP